jgi:DNA-binding GntR family transcriptional regulator
VTDSSASPVVAAASVATGAVLNSPEVIAEALRRAILRGELAPGEHVRQPEWSEQLGVSRAVLREAFKILTGERLLRHSPQAGYFVSKLNNAEMKQLYRIRMFVEEEILRSIRWPTAEELVVFEELFDRYQELFRAGDIINAMEVWRDYTLKLFNLSPLKLMISEAMRLREMASPYRMVGLTTMLVRDPELQQLEGIRHQQLTALQEHDLEPLVESIVRDRTNNVDTAMLSLFGAGS